MNTSTLDKEVEDRDSLKDFDIKKFHVFQIWNFALSSMISAIVALVFMQMTREAWIAALIFGFGSAAISLVATFAVYRNGYLLRVSQMLPIGTAFFAFVILSILAFFRARSLDGAVIAASSALFVLMALLEYVWNYLPKLKDQIIEAGKPDEFEEFYSKEFGVKTIEEVNEIYKSATGAEKERMTNLFKARIENVKSEMNSLLDSKKTMKTAAVRTMKSLGIGVLASAALFLLLLPFVKNW